MRKQYTKESITRHKARERIDTVLSSMDTINLYLTAAALWRNNDEQMLAQPDMETYAECARILAEDVHHEAQPARTERDRRIGVILHYLVTIEDEKLLEITPRLIHESVEARQREQTAAAESPNILQFPGCC